MRIAALADIHGNLPALEAVVADLHAMSPDMVVNLGDHVSGPLWSAETAEFLMNQRGWIHVRGNHDRNLVELAPEAMGQSDRAACERLSAAHLEWLRCLPATCEPEAGLLLCHGTPADDREYLIEDVSTGYPRLPRCEELRQRVPGRRGLILCGHSHVPRLVHAGGDLVLANPGSAGLQAYDDPEHRHPHVVETGSPHARYLVLDGSGTGWVATFRLIAYDWELAARRALDGGRPEWAHALRTGFAPRAVPDV